MKQASQAERKLHAAVATHPDGQVLCNLYEIASSTGINAPYPTETGDIQRILAYLEKHAADIVDMHYVANREVGRELRFFAALHGVEIDEGRTSEKAA